MNREVRITVAIMISSTAILLFILGFHAISEINRLTDEIIKTKIDEVLLISSRIELRIQYVAGIMELTSKNPILTEPPIYSNLITEELKGIPEDADIEKRNVAKHMLDESFDFDYVFYVMPNGDIYFLEPFYSQLNLTRLNFAFRDWYTGAINTGSLYISEAYISDNIKHEVVAVSIPLHDDATKSFNGLWVAALNIGAIKNIPSQLNLGQNEYILIVDHNQNIVADTRETKTPTELQKTPLSIESESTGTTKTIVQEIDGKNMFVTSRTIPVGTHQWTVMSIQPYDEAFLPLSTFAQEAMISIFSIVSIMGISGFFVIRKITANIMLAKKLEDANSELSHIDSAKDEFSAMVTHELKTPLVPIIGYCKMLKTAMLGRLNDEQAKAVDVIEKSAKRLEMLITDIMDARKLDMEKMKFNFENLKLDGFFENIFASYKKVLDERGIDLVTKLDFNDVEVSADESRLRQVFDNLIGNAIKFLPQENGQVEIGGYEENTDIVMYVKDNGIGIPKEKQENLFKKFYQIDTSERRPIGGTGLGLAISKGIMEKMNGTIWVQSDEKTGTTFYLKLPQKVE